MDTDQAPAKSTLELSKHRFRDADEASEFMSVQREYRVLPLSLKPFQANLYRVNLNGLLVMHFGELATTVQIRGERRPGFINFSLPLAENKRLSYLHQRPFDLNTLGGFDITRSFNSVYQQNLCVGALWVRDDWFETTRAMMGRDDLDEHFLKQDLIYLPTTLSRYRHYLQELLQLAKLRSPLLQNPDFCRLVQQDLLPLLIDAIPRQAPQLQLAPTPRRPAQLVSRARDYIVAHIHEPLTLTDLYTALGVSRRTLYYSFESVFGLTPMEYIKVQRLQGARRSLLAADPNTASVISIAIQWGFWHSGQFARDYKTMFGELPSDTLRRA